MEVELNLLQHQYDFVNDLEHRELAMVAGYGSGKTFAFCLKSIYLAFLNVGHRGAMLEPTNAMNSDVLIPEMTALLHEYDIPFSYRASPYPIFTLHFAEGDSDILVRSAENYKRLAGLNLAWFGVDECDTIDKKIAWRMWRLLQSRLRARAPYVQGFTTSTPEGYNFLYEYFVKEPGDHKRIIHASTYDNPYLEDDFIPSLLRSYPKNLIISYLHGKFTNLNTGNVYDAFDRHLNHTNKVIEDFDTELDLIPLHIGMDFNVGKCCAIIHIIDEDGNPMALDEITGQKNTESISKKLMQRFPKRKIYIYPDASGRSEKTNATTTDLQILKGYFTVRVDNKNPLVKDRVNTMNAMFLNGEGQRRYFVNTNKCKVYTEALETQGYDDFGKPDKAHDQDHPVDASGYFIHKRYPIKRNSQRITLLGT